MPYLYECMSVIIEIENASLNDGVKYFIMNGMM